MGEAAAAAEAARAIPSRANTSPGSQSDNPGDSQQSNTSQAQSAQPAAQEEPEMTAGQENALQAAEDYLDYGILEGGSHPPTVGSGRRRLLEG